MTNIINKFKENIFMLIITGSLFFASLITLNIFGLNLKIQHKWIIIFLFSIVFLLFTRKSKYICKNFIKDNGNNFLALWEVLIVSIFISKYVHNELVFLEFILYSIIIPITFFNKKIKTYKNAFLLASVLSMIPYMYILGPGNGLGIMICISGVNLLNLMRINKVKEIYLYITIVGFTTLIFITKSRTSLISFLFVSVIIIFATLKNRKVSSKKVTRNILTILVFIILIYFFRNYINTLLLGKYPRSNLDMLSGRGRMWSGTVKKGIRWFGNGETYFMDTYKKGDAHNIFIQVLGSYGLISFISLIIMYVYIFFNSIKNLKSLDYICFFSVFLLLGLGENIFFVNSRMIYSSILFFMYLGCLINEKEQCE